MPCYEGITVAELGALSRDCGLSLLAAAVPETQPSTQARTRDYEALHSASLCLILGSESHGISNAVMQLPGCSTVCVLALSGHGGLLTALCTGDCTLAWGHVLAECVGRRYVHAPSVRF